MADRRTTLRRSLRHLLRPLVQFCIKNSLSVQDLYLLAKEVFVEVGAREIERAGSKVNVSRLSVTTGVHRREVTRILRGREGESKEPDYLISRVIGIWERDPAFQNENGKPRALTMGFDASEFNRLVRLVSKNVNPASVLFEMNRLGIVKILRDGVKLLREDATMRRDEVKAYELLSKDVEALMHSVGENVANVEASPHLHFHTEFDNIYAEDVPRIKKWLVSQGRQFHRRVRNYLAKSDHDVAPVRKKSAPGARIVCTSFAYSALPEDSASNE